MSEPQGTGSNGDRLDRELNRVPPAVAPPRDLWPAIAARLTPRAGRGGSRDDATHAIERHWFGWGQLAAAVVLVVVSSLVTVVVMRDRLRQETAATVPAPSGDAAAVAHLPTAMPASFGGRQGLGEEYLEAREALTTTFETRLAALSPAQRDKVERNLADIQRAAAELSATLEEHPGSGLLQDLLLSTYQDELNLLAQVNDVTEPMLPRNDL